jgi:hypothetical protein
VPEDDSVSIAFELVQIELSSEVESLNSKGASLFYSSDYTSAGTLIERGKRLKAFCEKVAALEAQWRNEFAADFPQSPNPELFAEARRAIISATKSSKTLLFVRFPDGAVVSMPKAAETLALTIKMIGFDRVASLGKVVNFEPLVSSSPSKKYADVKIDGVYIKTHSSTSAKKKLLDEISGELGLNLEVRIIEN